MTLHVTVSLTGEHPVTHGYESVAGVTLDPWWDLYAPLHHDESQGKWIRRQVAGRRPVDVPGMTSRIEVAIETALQRLG